MLRILFVCGFFGLTFVSPSGAETIKITGSNISLFTQPRKNNAHACYIKGISSVRIGNLSRIPLQARSTWTESNLGELQRQILYLTKQLSTGAPAGTKIQLDKKKSLYAELQNLKKTRCRTTSQTPTPTPTRTATTTPAATPTAISSAGFIDTSCNPGSGTDYRVGDGQTYPSLSVVPWGSLMPGDSVRLFYRSAPYREKVFLTQSGTPSNPITFCGVLGPNGERPILDGDGATTSSSLSLFAPGTLEPLGVVMISLAGGAPWLSSPTDINVKNLEVRSAFTTYTFTDHSGVSKHYTDGASALYIWRAKRVRITNMVLHDSGNGMFVNSGGGFGTQDIILEGSYIYGNGDPASYLYHNVYTESDGMIYQYNRFGPLRTGAPGNNVKDRSSGTIFRYNWVLEGGHLIDLVEAQNNPDNAAKASYQKTYVYGNTFINGTTSDGGATFLVHFGGDQGVPAMYRPNLEFYNNTVYTISNRTGANARWRTILFQLTSNSQTVNAWNNLLYSVAATNGQTPSGFDLMLNDGHANFGANWVSPGWNPWSDSGTVTGTISGTSNFISPNNNTPGFVDATFATFDPHLATAASAIDQGGTALDSSAASYPVDGQYVLHQQADFRPTDSHVDCGAFER